MSGVSGSGQASIGGVASQGAPRPRIERLIVGFLGFGRGGGRPHHRVAHRSEETSGGFARLNRVIAAYASLMEDAQ